MCGVVGLLVKDPSLEPRLGELLAPMMRSLSGRGPDSSGVAVYPGRESPPGGEGGEGGEPALMRLSVGCEERRDWSEVGTGLEARIGAPVAVTDLGSGAVLELEERWSSAARASLASHWPEVSVLGSGRSAVVAKAVGPPERLCAEVGLEGWGGYLAVGHTRMATESAVTIRHSHPFVPAPDLCMVHNGSFSNHASVRRRMQARGVVFESDNDSEVAARALAERLAGGDTLDDAAHWLMGRMDGFFTLVLSAPGQLSVVRDAFACKPAVVAETPSYVAVASEHQALAALPLIEEATVFEPGPEEVHTWTR